jgi:HECT-domain (ubiquitin-transferase)
MTTSCQSSARVTIRVQPVLGVLLMTWCHWVFEALFAEGLSSCAEWGHIALWLQGISGPQKFQIHKAYGPSARLPSAHTCFNQLDLIEYESKEQMEDRLKLAIREGSEGFGFG